MTPQNVEWLAGRQSASGDPKGKTCRWTYDDTHNKHDTGCGEAFTFNDGGTLENCFFYCPYCGRRITEA